mgnify:CR=1 FL=1
MNNKAKILRDIKELEDLYLITENRETAAYLNLINALKVNYENLGDEENAVKWAKEVEKFVINSNHNYPKEQEYLLGSYDTRARFGDFRAYCIALEWKRPIEKQFFLPRKRILEKHGLIQAMQDMVDDKLDFLFVSLPPRIGKNLSNSTPILTKKGWVKHGDLQVGDYVLNDKGRFVKVLATSPEYPCNCRVTFANGEQIDCHENHEWVVNDRHGEKIKNMETKEMIGKLRDNYQPNTTHNHFRFRVPLKEPILGEYKELPVEPYSLGVWIGDGTNRKNCITIDKNDKIIAETLNKYYPISALYIHKTYGTYNYYFTGLRQALQKLDMCYSRKTSIKHIPDIYLTSSLEQRLQLLAGLLDTDGTLVRKEHRYHYSTTEKQLMEDFVSLISTFGWRCSVSECEPKLSTSRIQGKKRVYTIGFNPTFEIPCRLERKQLHKFSKPRRIAITGIEKIENGEIGKCVQVEGGIYLAGKTLIPTHNSTLGLFLLTYMAGLHPERSILGNGHSTSLTQSFYNEILNVITGEEYRYGDIFPTITVKNKSAEYSWIDLNTDKRFHTLMFRSLEGATTGLAEASNILYCDDLIKDIETAESPARLDKIFYTYTSTVQDRKVQRLCKDGEYRPCPEIHIATRWSINDPIGRLIRIYDGENNPRVRIINIPCYDENGESNFLYDYGKGFNKEYYEQLQKTEDPITFRAKYLGEPMERTGHPFTKENLSFYTELPEGAPDRIISFADPSFGGKDYFSAPIGYQYGNEIYIEDVYYENNVDIDISRRRLLEKMIKHKVTKLGIEKNNGGLEYSELLTNDARKVNYRINITTHNTPTTRSKRDRILSCQSEIKGIAVNENTVRIYFKADRERENNNQYNLFMRHIYEWSEAEGGVQKTQRDDCIDSVASMIINILSPGNVGKASSKFSISKLGL